MSTDFIALFDATAQGITAQWLLRELDTGSPLLTDVVERYRSRWRVQSWSVEASRVSGEAELIGPGGFVFRFPRGIVEVYHLIPFVMFAQDAEPRTQLRRVWQCIASLVGSSRAIYTHELMPYPGASLAEIEANLRATIGPPALSFDELQRAELFGPRAWHVDDFGDLRALPTDAGGRADTANRT